MEDKKKRKTPHLISVVNKELGDKARLNHKDRKALDKIIDEDAAQLFEAQRKVHEEFPEPPKTDADWKRYNNRLLDYLASLGVGRNE